MDVSAAADRRSRVRVDSLSRAPMVLRMQSPRLLLPRSGSVFASASAPFPKFVIHRGTLSHELRKQRGTSKYLILVPLIDLKFPNGLAADDAGTSNRRQ